ncbi:MAG TPA: hypothetical protein VG276_19860 [Actinomycetes bacterium]|nr:hypothetical protein [Actinomycetes bacterium]
MTGDPRAGLASLVGGRALPLTQRSQLMWEVEYTQEARAQRATLPAVGRGALDEVVVRLGRDPAQGPRYRAGYPAEYRMLPFGEWGLVVYLVHERRRVVVLLDIVWAGP